MSKHYNAGNAPNGITPDKVIEELNGSIISVKPESIYDNFDKASATNKGEDLSARTELKMAAFMQIIQESYIQGKQIFGVN
ncbi:hypothetical protein PII48_24510, partial [Serratia sp. 21NM0010]|uniref:hypothetical protein n=1 Tax=Serratia sarumanii TaxID=3020826 RepID=UPI0023306295